MSKSKEVAKSEEAKNDQESAVLESLEYTLLKPMEHDGNTITKLKFRWPNGSDMEAMHEYGNEMSRVLTMASRLSGVPRDVFESQCHGKDMNALNVRLADFL